MDLFLMKGIASFQVIINQRNFRFGLWASHDSLCIVPCHCPWRQSHISVYSSPAQVYVSQRRLLYLLGYGVWRLFPLASLLDNTRCRSHPPSVPVPVRWDALAVLPYSEMGGTLWAESSSYSVTGEIFSDTVYFFLQELLIHNQIPKGRTIRLSCAKDGLTTSSLIRLWPDMRSSNHLQ
jgi:hypothetical protein